MVFAPLTRSAPMPWETGSIARSCCVRVLGRAGGVKDPRAGLGELLVAEASPFFFVPTKVVAQGLEPDLAGHGFRYMAGDVVGGRTDFRHLVAGERDGDASR